MRMQLVQQLNVENKRGIRFSLDLRGRIVVIDGNSGTGKTFLWSTIKTLQDAPSTRDKVKNILLLNYKSENVEEKIKSSEGNLIIIDNGDLILSPDMAHYISFDYANQYLIFQRGNQLEFGISPNYYAYMVDYGDHIGLKYEYSVRGWY